MRNQPTNSSLYLLDVTGALCISQYIYTFSLLRETIKHNKNMMNEQMNECMLEGILEKKRQLITPRPTVRDSVMQPFQCLLIVGSLT